MHTHTCIHSSIHITSQSIVFLAINDFQTTFSKFKWVGLLCFGCHTHKKSSQSENTPRDSITKCWQGSWLDFSLFQYWFSLIYILIWGRRDIANYAQHRCGQRWGFKIWSQVGLCKEILIKKTDSFSSGIQQMFDWLCLCLLYANSRTEKSAGNGPVILSLLEIFSWPGPHLSSPIINYTFNPKSTVSAN